MRLKIYGFRGYLVFIDFWLLLAESKKAIEFMTPMPKLPMVGAN
jgi:hypothetical protein